MVGVGSAESKNDLRRERTREQILDAAHVALIRDGYERITTRRIAEEAGVNVATLHYYFGSKEALLSDTIEYAMERVAHRLRTAAQGAPDAATALERSFQATWELVKERPGVLRYDLVVRGMRDAEAHRQVTAIYSMLQGLVLEILERHLAAGNQLAPGMTSGILCRYLVAAIDGVILQHLVFADDADTVGCLKVILDHAKSLLEGGSRVSSA